LSCSAGLTLVNIEVLTDKNAPESAEKFACNYSTRRRRSRAATGVGPGNRKTDSNVAKNQHKRVKFTLIGYPRATGLDGGVSPDI